MANTKRCNEEQDGNGELREPAIVKCTVSVCDQEFHNIRLFVRREGGWKLLAWANEPL